MEEEAERKRLEEEAERKRLEEEAERKRLEEEAERKRLEEEAERKRLEEEAAANKRRSDSVFRFGVFFSLFLRSCQRQKESSISGCCLLFFPTTARKQHLRTLFVILHSNFY